MTGWRFSWVAKRNSLPFPLPLALLSPLYMRFFAIIIFFMFVSGSVVAQELPPVLSFEANTYRGGNQNWMLGQDKREFIYAANNDGLLEYDGSRWTLYPSPNESILRSVLAVDERVYTGSYREFGYWKRDAFGRLRYQSLSGEVMDKMVPDEQFWNIRTFEGMVVFQSLHQFFLYNPLSGDIKSVYQESGLTRSFQFEGELYFTDNDQTLKRLSNGRAELVAAGGVGRIIHLWRQGDRVLAQTATGGTYRLVGDTFVPTKDHPFLWGKRVYSAISLRDGGHAFGTIAHGIYVVGPDGQPTYHLDQVSGLTNNTVLSLYEDTRSNLWAGTDNGISCINRYSPFRKFTDLTGMLGTVHASAWHDGTLYLGTNQGLFVRDEQGADAFCLVPGTEGQVWSLYRHKGTLLMGHDGGTFVVRGKAVEALSRDRGSWGFQPIPGQDDLLLQGDYEGMAVLERVGERWRIRNRVMGFDYSCRFFAARPGPEVFVSHEYLGVFGLLLDPDFRSVTRVQHYDASPPGKNAGLAAFQDSIFYFSRKGLFSLRDFEHGFVPAGELNSQVDSAGYLSGTMIEAGQRLWFFNQQSLRFLQPSTLSGKLKWETIPVSAALINAKSGYENITSLPDKSLLIGTVEGYLLLKLDDLPLPRHELYLTGATADIGEGGVIDLPLAGVSQLPAQTRRIAVSLTVPVFSKYFTPRFQYRLPSIQDEWSAWSTSAELNFTGLPYGEYALEVRSLHNKRMAERPATFAFSIARAWYLSYPALIAFGLAGMLTVYLFHRAYTRYYRRKEKHWQAENERKIAASQRETELALSKLNNEQLQQDITAKNREMALSTMNLVKKTELLQEIKDNLTADKSPTENIARVVRIIDTNIDEAGTWQLFKEAFENADREFFKTIRDRHQELTPNDLKLCAYLRLNLSSKEIAPMLNISVRSVEVKRYRLRKKMGLDREVGLVDYILSV